MKICGCNSCKNRGEIDPYEQFELYYSTRELEMQAVFKKNISDIFSVQELHDYEMEFAGQHLVNVLSNINQYAPDFDAQSYWTKYGGSLNGWKDSQTQS